MSSTVDLSDVPDLPVPHEVLSALSDRAEQHGIEMLVIGAAARDLVVHAPTERSKRATDDVDVAVAVDRVQFERFTHGWERVRGSEHKFTVLGIEVDVVPFGPMERGRTVELNDGHRLDVNGLAEAGRAAAAPFTEEDGTQVLAVLDDEPLAEKLARRMGGIDGLSLLGAFAAGFRVGLRGL